MVPPWARSGAWSPLYHPRIRVARTRDATRAADYSARGCSFSSRKASSCRSLVRRTRHRPMQSAGRGAIIRSVSIIEQLGRIVTDYRLDAIYAFGSRAAEARQAVAEGTGLSMENRSDLDVGVLPEPDVHLTRLSAPTWRRLSKTCSSRPGWISWSCLRRRRSWPSTSLRASCCWPGTRTARRSTSSSCFDARATSRPSNGRVGLSCWKVADNTVGPEHADRDGPARVGAHDARPHPRTSPRHGRPVRRRSPDAGSC